MKKLIQIIMFALITVLAFSQSVKYELAWADSSKKKMVVRSIVTGQDGSRIINQTPEEDSVKALDQYLLIMDNRKKAFEKDFGLMDSGLIASVGMGYAQLKRASLISKINWTWTSVIALLLLVGFVLIRRGANAVKSKPVKKTISLAIMILCMGSLYSQSIKYELVKSDSSKYYMRSIEKNKDGSLIAKESMREDSAAAVDRYIQIMDNRKNAFERDFELLDSGIIKSIGLGYDHLIKGKVANEIVGNWMVKNGDQELMVTITKDHKVLGGTIKGSVAVLDKDTIELKGVLSKQFTVSRKPGNKFLGVLDGKELTLSRPTEIAGSNK